MEPARKSARPKSSQEEVSPEQAKSAGEFIEGIPVEQLDPDYPTKPVSEAFVADDPAGAEAPTRVQDAEPAEDKDKEYRPGTSSIPEQFLPNPDFIKPLDQGSEGAAVGHGMASMINYLLQERGIRDQVSARMLQQLSKQYDNQPLDVDHGSTLSSGMKAWLENGVCSASLWPYRPGEWGEFTPERRRAALKYRPASYRWVPNDVRIMQAALVECHAVVASGSVHNGWMSDSAAKTGRIPFSAKGKKTFIGGHAFALVGYTQQGFIIQNSWGNKWGGVEVQGRHFPGCALWSYEDFKKNYQQGFVAALRETLDSRTRLRRAGYQSDTTEGRDMLDIRSDVRAVSALLAARDVKPPLALGLFGNWGTGKTFFMARMYDEIDLLAKLERENPGQTPYCSEIVQIRFNAWHFLDANLWASLVDEIFKSLLAASSGPAETNQAARRRVAKQLGEARGLYRQSQVALDQAKTEQQRAETDLTEKQKAVSAQSDTLAGVYDQLKRLLADQPEVQQQLDRLADAVGEPDLARSYQALKQQAEEVRGVGGLLKKLWQEIWKPEGRTRRLILLVLFPSVCAFAAFGVNHLLQQESGLLGTLHRWINSVSGLLFGAAVWLASQISKVTPVITSLQRITRKVDAIHDQRIAELTATERRKLEMRQQAEQEARARVEQARQRVNSLETELQELNPARQMQSFIRERSSAEDYRKQLGLVSLVRRDFERLSELLALSEALEDRWYERKLEAERANKPFRRPRRTLLPMRRIVLYIDDLDRCQPDRVVEVLEAVHLLLAFPLFVVVVAVDPRWLRECLEMHYPRLLATSDTGRTGLITPSTPQDYLEKIFQIPFYLRPISNRGYRNLIDGLMNPDLELGTSAPAQTSKPSSEQPQDLPAVEPPNASESSVAPGMLGIQRPPDREQSTAGGEQMDDSDQMNPEKLKFQPWEVSDMKRLERLFRTPRAVKRFVNTYRLVRVGIPESDLDEFIGTEKAPGRYPIAQMLLAIVCGYPNAAPWFLRLLLQQSRLPDQSNLSWSEFVAKCSGMGDSAGNNAEQSRTGQGAKGRKRRQSDTVKSINSAAESADQLRAGLEGLSHEEFGREWQELCEALSHLDERFVPGNLASCYDMVRRAARFSFSVSALPE